MTQRALLIGFLTAVISAPSAAGQGQVGQAPGPGRGPGGPGGIGGEQKIVERFDRDKNGRLNAAERREARTWLAEQAAAGRGGRGFGGRGGVSNPPAPGPRETPANVKPAGRADIYTLDTVRTFFIDFESADWPEWRDWEEELEAFNNTDVDVPATVTVDGRKYLDVGVHFRGASSFGGVPRGSKRSINLAFDFADEDQNLGGYRTFNLLNAHTDASFLRTVLYLQIARAYLPAPKANFVRVVINGEYWGLYPNAQQFNKDFVRDFFKTTDGARWKVPGSPGGRGGLEYLGEDVAAYKRLYEIKTKDDRESWTALITLCRVLNETAPEKLEAALAPMLDVNGVLRYLALENVFVNADGYWTRASDYSLYRDTKGRFHVIPHDANETFSLGRGGGPGRGRGPGGPPPPGAAVAGAPPPPPPPPGGVAAPGQVGAQPGGPGRGRGAGTGNPELDPLIGLNDPNKPLRSKLLAVPALRERYMSYVNEMARTWLDWKKLEPIVARHQALIRPHVIADTKKLDTIEAFDRGAADLKAFADARLAFLMKR